MAFSWTAVTAGVTIATAAQINEVKTNTDLLADGLSIAHYSWSEMPVAPGDFMKAAQITELQDALDYIDANNVCSAQNAVRYVTNQSGQNSGIDVTKNNTVDVDQHATYNSNVDTVVYSTRYTVVDNDQHNSYLNNQNTGYLATQYTQVDSDQHYSYCGGYNSTIYSLLDSTYYASRNNSAK